MNIRRRWMPGVAVIVFILTSSPLMRGQEAATGPLAASVKPFVEKQELAGAVMLVANREKVLSTEVAGWADIAQKRPMTADTVVWIASQSKPITAAAVMILVDEGKVKLDDPIEKYLPEFRGQMYVAEKTAGQQILRSPSRRITLRDTLCHTSGMPFKSALEVPTLDAWPLDLRVRSYAMTPLESHPGARYQYSNAGINTAARVIEVVTGKSFDSFLDERLFQPLGMTQTSFWPSQSQADRIAVAYKPGPDKKGLIPTRIDQLYYPLTNRTERFAMPAGGLFATASDLARFYRMLLNDGSLDGRQILSPAAVMELTRKQTPVSLKENYGLGLSVGEPDTFGHGGAYSTNSSADRKRDLILIWLVQHAGFPGNGEKAQGEFRQAATKAFAKQK